MRCFGNISMNNVSGSKKIKNKIIGKTAMKLSDWDYVLKAAWMSLPEKHIWIMKSQWKIGT